MITERPGFVRTIAAADFAASVAPATAIPTSAFLRGGVVHAVAGHADDMPPGLEEGDDPVLVLGEDLGEPGRSLDDLRRPGIVLSEEGVGGGDLRPEAHLPRDLAGDRGVVAGDHLDVEPHLHRRPDGRRGVGTGRVVEAEDAGVGPGAGGVAPCDAEHPITLLREGPGEAVDRPGEVLSSAGEGEDHLRRALRDRELAAVGAPDGGLGALRHGIEGLKAGDGEGGEPVFETLPLLRLDDRDVDGVPVLLTGGEEGGKQDVILPEPLERDDLGKGEPVLRDRPGLVGAEDVHPGHLLDGDEPADDGLLPGKRRRPHGHGDREDGRHRRGDGRHDQDERELEGFEKALLPDERDDEDHGDEGDREHDQVVADPDDGLPEVACRRRLTGEPGGFAEEGFFTCSHDERGHLPPFDGGAGVGYIRYVLLDRHRLPGESGLVGREIVPFDEFDIGGHDVPVPDPDDIAGDEVPCGDRLPPAVAKHPCLEREPLF